MSSQRYRRLLTNLPSMASVVNTFQSPEVQREVYQLLVEALDDAVGEEEGRGDSVSTPAALVGERPRRSGRRGGGKPDEALADVVEGDSIHSLNSDN